MRLLGDNVGGCIRGRCRGNGVGECPAVERCVAIGWIYEG